MIESHLAWKTRILSGLIISCDLNNFRDGAFRGLITADMTFEKAIEVFLRSDKLSSAEKKNYITPILLLVKRCELLERQRPDERVLLEQRGRVRRYFEIFPQMEREEDGQGSGGKGEGQIDKEEKREIGLEKDQVKKWLHGDELRERDVNVKKEAHDVKAVKNETVEKVEVLQSFSDENEDEDEDEVEDIDDEEDVADDYEESEEEEYPY